MSVGCEGSPGQQAGAGVAMPVIHACCPHPSPVSHGSSPRGAVPGLCPAPSQLPRCKASAVALGCCPGSIRHRCCSDISGRVLQVPTTMAVPSLAFPTHVPCVSSHSHCVGLGALCSSSPWLCWGRTMSSLGATRGLSSWSRPEASPRDSPAWGWERRSKPEGEFRVGDAAVVSL